jgi:Zinc finger, C3HC4 type (RING finger)
MASAGTQVSLHCIICYEEFDLKDRHPVVLPCGHTYVCIVCAKRLKKCMECREPLFWSPPRPPNNNNNLHHLPHRSPAHPRYPPTRTVARMSAARYSPSPQTPPHPSMATATTSTSATSGTTTTGANNNAAAAEEPQPLPLPKNLVLMEMIEAKERQHRLLKEARRREEEIRRQQQQEAQLQQLQEALEGNSVDQHHHDSSTNAPVVIDENLMDADPEEEDDDEEEEEWVLDPTLSGMAAFSGSCGTYVVREPMGLVVLPQDPNRRHQQPASPTPSPKLPVDIHTSSAHDHPHHRSRRSLSSMKAPQPPPTSPDQDEKKEPAFGEEDDLHSSFHDDHKEYHHPQPFYPHEGHHFVADEDEHDHDEDPDDDSDGDASVLHPDSDHLLDRHHHQPREPFTLYEGQKVQVVGVEEGVYQLARGAGYIVATVNQLVKGTYGRYCTNKSCLCSERSFSHKFCLFHLNTVGGPLEMSCKLEGMLQSVTRKQTELQEQLDEINRLARGLREKIVLEQSKPEQHPVIFPPRNAHMIDGQLVIDASDNHCATVPENSNPTTPTKYGTTNNSSPTTGGSGGNQSVLSDTSTHVELGAPRTPGPPQSSAMGPFLEMEHGSGSGSYAAYDQYVNSPAHSCPMPSVSATAHLSQPFIDGAPTGLPRYRVNSDDDMYGMGWAGALGCGSTLFGERLLESSRHGSNSILSAAGNDILALSFDEHSLLDNASTRNRAMALAAAAGANTGSQDSPLRSGGSFDGVNFRTGMSGHSGVSQPKRNRNAHHTGLINASSATLPRRQIRMMSEHRGVAHLRGTGPTPGLKRRTTPDAVIGSHEYERY